MTNEDLYVIEKSYRKLQISDKEKNKFIKYMTAKNSGRKQPLLDAKNKKAINNIYYDKYGRLWVKSSIERNDKNKNETFFDIFKDGVFLRTIKTNIAKADDFINPTELIYFKNEKIYVLDIVESTVKVFNYYFFYINFILH